MIVAIKLDDETGDEAAFSVENLDEAESFADNIYGEEGWVSARIVEE